MPQSMPFPVIREIVHAKISGERIQYEDGHNVKTTLCDQGHMQGNNHKSTQGLIPTCEPVYIQRKKAYHPH